MIVGDVLNSSRMAGVTFFELEDVVDGKDVEEERSCGGVRS